MDLDYAVRHSGCLRHGVRKRSVARSLGSRIPDEMSQKDWHAMLKGLGVAILVGAGLGALVILCMMLVVAMHGG